MENPELFVDAASGLFHPVMVDGEVFLLKRSELHFAASFIDENGTEKSVAADGYIFLSTLRLVFVVSKMGPGFQSFDIPISLIRKEGFKQPVFGSNYLYGIVDRWRVGPTKFKLYFYNGGAGVFLKVFIDLLTKHRSCAVGRNSDFVAQAASGQLQQDIHQAAYVDPSDPTSVFLTQPANAPSFGDGVEMCDVVHSAADANGAALPTPQQSHLLCSACRRSVESESSSTNSADGSRQQTEGRACASATCDKEVGTWTEHSRYARRFCDSCALKASRCAVCGIAKVKGRPADGGTGYSASEAAALDESSENQSQEDATNGDGDSPCAVEADVGVQEEPTPIIIPTWIARQERPYGAGATELRRRVRPKYEDYTRS